MTQSEKTFRKLEILYSEVAIFGIFAYFQLATMTESLIKDRYSL